MTHAPDSRIRTAISELAAANRDFAPVPAFHEAGDLALEDAYRIQRGVYAEVFGGAPSGYKVSLVAPEHRAAFNATEPTFGRLAATQLVEAPAEIRLASMFRPLVEPELVFLVDADLPKNASADQIRAHSRVTAGLEIPDSRLAGWYPVPDQTVSDLVADASFAGKVVYSPESVAASDVDLPAVTCRMVKDGVLIGEGVGANVMDDPVNAVTWLSEALAREGLTLNAGAVVSAGTFFYPPVAEAGTYTASYDGVGEVSVTFV